jgi:hypothetical protein
MAAFWEDVLRTLVDNDGRFGGANIPEDKHL